MKASNDLVESWQWQNQSPFYFIFLIFFFKSFWLKRKRKEKSKNTQYLEQCPKKKNSKNKNSFAFSATCFLDISILFTYLLFGLCRLLNQCYLGLNLLLAPTFSWPSCISHSKGLVFGKHVNMQLIAFLPVLYNF